MRHALVERDELARLADARAVACTDVLRLGSLTCRVHAGRSHDRDALFALFRTEPGRHAGVEACRPSARIAAFDVSPADGVVAAAPPDGLSMTAAGGGRWRIATDVLTAHLFAQEPIELYLAVGERPRDENAFRVHLSVVVHRALLLLERIYLHAAAVDFGGLCLVFAGDKGSGKSTLSLSLGAAGATVLADDHVVLRRDGARFLASGCNAEARLLEDAERHLFGTAVDARIVELGGVRKKEIPVGRFFSSLPFREHHLDRLVFPRIGDAFGVRPMPRREALVRLMDATRAAHRFSGAGDLDAYLDYLSALVEAAEPFALELSPRLAELDRLVDWVRGGAA